MIAFIKNIFNTRNTFLAVIFILTFFFGFLYNEINIHALKKESCENLRSGETVITADDYSYLAPPVSFLKNKIWKENDIETDKRSYFLRPPGYGVLYMLHVLVFGESNALKFLKFSQLFLFALSTVLLYLICQRLFLNKSISIVITAIYGISPFAMGFLFYTLTEGITPALVIFYLYFLTKAYGQKINAKKILFYLFAAFLLSVIIVTRPVLALFGVFFIFYLVQEYRQKKRIISFLKQCTLYGLISFSLFAAWSIRNYSIAGEFVGFHPIYYNESNSIYRKTHQAIWDFYKCWGINNEDFHALITTAWDAGMAGDTSEQCLNKAIKAIPDEVKEVVSVPEVLKAFKIYQSTILVQKQNQENGIAMPKKLSFSEINTISSFNHFRDKYVSKHFFKYHFLIPMKNFWRLTAHSNLSLFIFQKTWRGNAFMEFFRGLFFFLHLGLLMALFFSVILFKKDLMKIVYPLTALIYLFFICYVLKEWEERYTLPLLPICLINAGFMVDALITFWQSKRA